MTEEEEFDALLFQIIDEQLKSLVGETATKLFYRHLVNQYSLHREDIPKNIDAFAKALKDFFGSSAYAIQKILLTKIYAQFGRPLRENSFVDSIAKLRESLIRERLKNLDW